MGDDRGGEVAAGTLQVLARVAVLGEKVGDLGVEGSDALVEIVDVVAEFADAAGCDSLSQAVAEGDALEFAQLALAVTAKGGGFADGSCCVRQNGAAGCLGAVSDKPSSLQLAMAPTISGPSAGPSSSRAVSTT